MRQNIGVTSTRDPAAHVVRSAQVISPPTAREPFGVGGARDRRVDILAHSLYRELTAQGFESGEIIGFTSALLGELISHRRPNLDVSQR